MMDSIQTIENQFNQKLAEINAERDELKTPSECWRYLLKRALVERSFQYFEHFFKRTQYISFSFSLIKLLPDAWNMLGKSTKELNDFITRLRITAGIIYFEIKIQTEQTLELQRFCQKILNIDSSQHSKSVIESKRTKLIHIVDKILRFEFDYFATKNRIRCYFNFDFGKKVLDFNKLETYLVPTLKVKFIRDHPPSTLKIPSKIYDIDISLQIHSQLSDFINKLGRPYSQSIIEINPKMPFKIIKHAEVIPDVVLQSKKLKKDD